MALSARARQKGAATAGPMLPANTVTREYVIGRAQARVMRGAVIATSLFVAAFVVALAFGRILIPGVLILAYVISVTRPARAVVVADQGLVLLSRSELNGRPTAVLAYQSLEAVSDAAQAASGHAKVGLGPDMVTFRQPEYQRLLAAVATARGQYVWPAPGVPGASGY
jgi:hypothetical protein